MDASPFKTLDLESNIIEAIRQCYDPEIPVNIYDLGLIYSVDVQPEGAVNVRMTLTSPMCPVAGTLPPEVEQRVREVSGVTDANVEVVWDPPWNPDMMSEAAKLDLGFF
jgi:FeS assembly SUF system protein